VVGGARAGAAAHDESTRGTWERRTTIAADDAGAVPSETTLAARTPVCTATAAAILIVGGWMGVGRAATGVSGSATRVTAVRIAFDTGVGEIRQRGIGHEGRSAGDAFALGAVRGRGAEGNVVSGQRTCRARELAAGATAEADTVDAEYAAERKLGSYVDGEHAAGRAVPGHGRWRRGIQCHRRVLRNADDLERSLALGSGCGRLGVGVEQSFGRTSRQEAERAASDGHSAGGRDEFKVAGVVESSGAGAWIAWDAVAIRASIG